MYCLYSHSSGGVLQLSRDDLDRACDKFSSSRLIGKGGFGEVYRGYLRSNTNAVKLLNNVCNSIFDGHACVLHLKLLLQFSLLGWYKSHVGSGFSYNWCYTA